MRIFLRHIALFCRFLFRPSSPICTPDSPFFAPNVVLRAQRFVFLALLLCCGHFASLSASAAFAESLAGTFALELETNVAFWSFAAREMSSSYFDGFAYAIRLDAAELNGYAASFHRRQAALSQANTKKSTPQNEALQELEPKEADRYRRFLSLRQTLCNDNLSDNLNDSLERDPSLRRIERRTSREPSTTEQTERAQTSATSASARQTTGATLKINAANIPLLAEPMIDTEALADSLNVRRGARGGALRRKEISGIPFSPQYYQFSAQFDSTQLSNAIKMRVRERLFGAELRPEQTLGLDDYLSERIEYFRAEIQDSLLHHYDFRRPFRMELANLLGQAGNFNIPFPQNPLTTVFGKPELRLNVNLELNLRIGSQWNATLGVGQASTLGAVQWVPIFQPNVQANVDAKIGDKFNINLDMNTLRQFEFDNLTRLAYDGEPDEIFRRVEFGNVTLNSPSTFISGSQALFGVRTDFQFGPVYLKTVASYKRGQSRVAKVKGGSVKQPIALRAYDYADNHFFINIAHKSVVWPVFERGGFPLQATPNTQQYRVKALEVWESTPDLREIQAAEVIAFDTLRPLRADVDTLINGTPAYRRADKQAIFDTTRINAGVVERGRFRLLRATERYTFDENLGTLRILNLRRDRTYAIAYRLEGATQGDADDLVYGSFQNTLDPNDTTKLVLQIVYRPNMQPAFRRIWARQRQNVYFIGATNVSTDPKDTRINFWYLRQNNDSSDILPGAQDKIGTVLGVDRVNNTSGAGAPDGVFDIHLPYIFDKARGEITFPSLEPFRQGLRNYFAGKGGAEQAEQYIFSAVYDTTRDAARLDAGRDRFIISGEVSGQASNRITLPNAFNLAPGGVKVRLNGNLLQEYTDYRVEYFTGQVELLNPQALLPNADVEVEYEQNDAFNLANRTMLGLRLDLDTKPIIRSRDVRVDFGMTAVNYFQDNPAARIRLGEESLSNTMLGVDGQITWNADWITKALDALPFFNTKAPSTITAKGEVAWMIPQPNTRPSEIRSDEGKPAVYIDDFEATQRIYALGLQPSQWRYASPPEANGIPSLLGLTRPEEVQNYRGAMRWFAFNEPRVPTRDIYPNRAITVGLGTNQNTRVFEVDFTPFERGIYNPNPNFFDSVTYKANPAELGGMEGYRRDSVAGALYAQRNQERIWGGIMRSLSAFNLNFDNENMDFIELVLRIDQNKTDPTTKMYIDVGQISEDIIPNGRLDTEDGILPGRETPNGRIANDEAEEDVGLDGLDDLMERGITPFDSIPPIVRAKYPNGIPYQGIIRNEPDPARDNFRYDADRFSTIAANAFQRDSDFVAFNGLEGNSRFQETQFPDTEILNPNNGQVIMLANDYFRYEVNLQPVRSNPQFVNITPQGFITLRIPLRGARTSVGNPLFTNIQYVRVLWVGGRFKGQIADWRFVGSQWIRQPALTPDGKLDSTTLSVGFVGREENAGEPFFYTMPPGVNPPIDRNNFLNPNQFRNEQSLLLRFEGLRNNEERSVSRFFRPFDAFFYRQMKFFLHGGENLTRVPISRADAQAIAFIRFGVDTLNYYEYSAPLKPGWQEIAINLPDLTGRKPLLQLTGEAAGLTVIPLPDGMGEYRIKGSPTLTRIQFVGFGLRNPGAVPGDLTTTMWVNELRLVEPDVSANLSDNMAAVGNVSAKIADLGNVSATINYESPYFHRLEERFGNRNERNSIAVTAQFGLERLFPEEWKGTNLPVSFTYNRSLNKPRFLAQNDVELGFAAFNEAERRAPGDSALQSVIARQIQESQETFIEDMQFAIAGARLNIPSYFFLFRDFLNRFTTDFNYVRRYERSPVVSLRSFEGWRFRLGYTHNFPPLPVKPFGWAENIPVLSWLSGWTLFAPLPNTLGASVEASQSFQREESRIEPDIRIPNILNFESARQLQFSWKIAENGFLNPTLDFSVNTVGTLVPLWLMPGTRDIPLPASEVLRQMSSLFGGEQFLNLGLDTRHGQNVRITLRPRLPDFMGGNKFFILAGSINSQYGWERLLRETSLTPDLNKAVGYQNTINAQLNIRAKDLGNTLFPTIGARQGGLQLGANAQTLSLPQPTTTTPSADDIAATVARVFKSLVFDWEQFAITFTQENSASNPGVLGRPGGMGETGLFNFANAPLAGPGLWYQLGLVEEPHNGLEYDFPFTFREIPGPRPLNVDLPDVLKRLSSIDLRTQREIIPGLQIELSWLSKFDLNRHRIATQLEGAEIPSYSNITELETFGRSFLGFGSLEDVERLYRLNPDTNTSEARQNALNKAFADGLEWLNFWGSPELRRVMPNINYALRWSGLEQLSLFRGILRSGSLESKYQGRYTATRRFEAGVETIDQQAVTSSFEPLLGVTAQFDDKFVEGIMSGNMRYGYKSSLGISQAQQGVVQSEVTHDFTMQISYTRRGFELPKIGGVGLLKLLGIDFEFTNDVEFALQATYRNMLRSSINVLAPETPAAAPGDAATLAARRIDGTVNILIEPSMRYTISKQVTARLFFKYEANLTEGAVAPGSSSTQVGVDLRLNLSGGRNF